MESQLNDDKLVEFTAGGLFFPTSLGRECYLVAILIT